ncbi:hypothetical protein ACE6H2_019655 [Prunus campanulata]
MLANVLGRYQMAQVAKNKGDFELMHQRCQFVCNRRGWKTEIDEWLAEVESHKYPTAHKIIVRSFHDLHMYPDGYGLEQPPKIFLVPEDVTDVEYGRIANVVSDILKCGLLRLLVQQCLCMEMPEVTELRRFLK